MDISVRRSDGLVVQYGHGLAPRPDCDVVQLGSSEATGFLAAMRNGQLATYIASSFSYIDPPRST